MNRPRNTILATIALLWLGVARLVAQTDTIYAFVSAGNGMISPSGTVVIPTGTDTTFVFTPTTGYHISEIHVDGDSVGIAGSYQFLNVTSLHTIDVQFAVDMITPTITNDPGGSVMHLPFFTYPPYAYGSEQTYQATPDADHVFAGWTGDTVTKQSSVTMVIGSSLTLHARFALKAKYAGGSFDGANETRRSVSDLSGSAFTPSRSLGGSYDGSESRTGGPQFLDDSVTLASRTSGGSYDGSVIETYGRYKLDGVALAVISHASGGPSDGGAIEERSRGTLDGISLLPDRAPGGSYDGTSLTTNGRFFLSGSGLALLSHSLGGAFDGAAGHFKARGGLGGMELLADRSAGGFLDGAGGSMADRRSLSGMTILSDRSQGGSFDGSDVLEAESDIALATTLTALMATSDRLNVKVAWRTSSEADILHFLVERAAPSDVHSDTHDWMHVGMVPADGHGAANRQYSIADHLPGAQLAEYRVTAFDHSGSPIGSSTVHIEVGIAPRAFALDQNYPNPFNPVTTLEFHFPSDGQAVVRVFDMLGREAATLFEGDVLPARYYQAVFDGASLSSGVYLARVEFTSEGTTLTLVRKMILLR